MEQWSPPQYSRDGRWWWNGYYWVAVGRPGRRFTDATWDDEEPRRRAPRPWLGLLALIVLAVLALTSGAAGWISRQGLPTGVIPGLLAPAPAPTPVPTATPDAGSGTAAGSGTVAAYRQMVTGDVNRFQAAGQGVGAHCVPAALGSGVGDCRAALQSMDDAAGRFQSDLDAQPAPACLTQADTELRSALSLYRQAIQQERSGLDNGDPAAVIQGAGTMGQATGHLKIASALIPGAC
jgi:hypothetical protein